MNHALSRLKKASSIAVASTSGSRASTAPAHGVDGAGNVLPAYGDGSGSSQRPLAMSEKSLPPGAAAYSHPATHWDQAQRERDELERAMKLSEEQDQFEAALRASEEAEEQRNERKQKEWQAEDAVLKQSQADHEAHEDQLAIIQAEEEQAILQAIRESEREAARGTAAKGKQTKRSSGGHMTTDSRAPSESSTSLERREDPAESPAAYAEEEEDEELRKAMELSMIDQEDDCRQQEELLYSAQQRHDLSDTAQPQASTSILPRQDSSSASRNSSSISVSRPVPPHPLPPRPGRAAPPPPTQTQEPALPLRRRLSEDEEYASVLDAPPPAYEAAPITTPPSSQAHQQTSPTPSTQDDAATYHSAMSTTESAREEARALEDKRQVFYPPVATNEMAEGSMRAFVPHMLFAARRRERSDPDEWFPMASRDVDLTQLPAQPQLPATPPSPAVSPPAQARFTSRPRRPLPPLPIRTGGEQPQLQPSALSQLDQKVAAISPTSPVSPSYYTASINPSSISTNAPSTTRAVENEDYQDDPFDDSQAALSDSDHMFQGSDADEHYNKHPSHTMHDHGVPRRNSPDSQLNNVSHGGSTSDAHTDETELTPPVARYDYARTRSRPDVSHLPPAHSPEPAVESNRVSAEQQDLANGEGYTSGESAVSWESTASEDDEVSRRRNGQPIDESAHDINTNISFGFNPLSSPNHHLDWQGRFPDLIVLSRFADADPRAATRQEEGTAVGQSKDDYRTFAFEAPTWRELLAYLMWHGNSIFEAATRDKESSTPDSLKVSLILEFVRTTAPPSTLVRLQIHLLSTSAGNTATTQAGEASNSGARGVALSRQPLSSRPSNYVRSSLPWQQPGSKDSTHLVLAFPKPYHTLPFSLGTIGTHLHNAHKAAVAQNTQQADHRIQLGDKSRINNTQFLTDLLRGIDMCSERSMENSNERQQTKSESPSQGAGAVHTNPDDSRFDRFVGRLKDRRHNMRGTLRELHKSSRSRKRRRKQAKDKGKGTLDGRAEDSDESYLDSQPKAEDYHITPYPANNT